MKDQPTTLWTLRTTEGRWVECVTRLVPNGIEVEIVSNGTRLYSRVFATGDDALAWADEERIEREPRNSRAISPAAVKVRR